MSDLYPPVGTKISGEVIEVTLAGIKVSLPGGRTGFIRRRELSWDKAVRDLDQFAAPGDTITVVIVAHDDGYGRLALSLRQVEYDPWEAFEAAGHREGQIVHGRVVNIVEYGAFVEVMRGVQGLVHVSEIADEWVSNTETYLWNGDWVEAVITKIDSEKKHVSLSIRERLRSLNRKTPADLSRRQLAEGIVDQLNVRRIHADQTVASDRPVASKRVLIVDDHDESRQSLSGFLERHGHLVTQARAGEAALEQVDDSFDIVFMDIDMPGMDGIETGRHIQARYPTIPIVVITSVNWAQARHAELDALGARDILLKPLDLDEVIAMVDAIQPQSSSIPVQVEDELSFFQRISHALDIGSLSTILAGFARELRTEVEAEAALILHRDPTSGDYMLAGYDSVIQINFEAIKYQLAFSPVREVLDDDMILFEEQARSKHGRFKYLRPLFPDDEFEACIGIPIKTSSQTAYGLFLFDRDARHFSRRLFRRALATASVIGASIERAEVMHQLRQAQQFVLAGQLSSSLLHEVNNRLSTLNTEVTNLRLDLKSAKRAADLPAITMQADRLATITQDVIKMAHLFQRLIKADRWEQVNLNEVIRSAAQVLRHRAYQAKLVIDLDLASGLPQLLSSEVRLTQVFINVMLNAIQQCGEGATIVARTVYEPDRDHPVQVRFSDDGPGIHHRHFERIFELGFTTRKDGSGLGLFISRGLIESIGGRIQVESSYLLIGTTFLIELPLEAPERDGAH